MQGGGCSFKMGRLEAYDKPDQLHHQIYVSSLMKLGTIYDYAKVTGSSFDDRSQFDLGDINALCWAASYVLNYKKYEVDHDVANSMQWLEQQQQLWKKRLRSENSFKVFREKNCATLDYRKSTKKKFNSTYKNNRTIENNAVIDVLKLTLTKSAFNPLEKQSAVEHNQC